MRNNNPGNIRHNSDVYKGEIRPSQDNAFKQFETMAYGYRALLRTLTTFQTKYHLQTIRQWISRWAPPSENNTEAYIAAVVRETGITEDKAINVNNKQDMCAIAGAISKHENGVHAEMSDVLAGWELLWK